ncbi:fibronectin type III domain protein, partial [Ostertagia ostertagi]
LPANVSSPYTVCRLHARTSYALSVEADNGFGKSPPARKVFFTDETVPSGAPAHIDVKPAVGAPSITVSWRKPSNATGHITRYHLYHKVHGHAKWKVDHLSVTRPEQTSYKFELNGLEPSTKYHFRLSASSTKGEGQRSVEHVVMTDVPVAQSRSTHASRGPNDEPFPVPAAPEISSLTFDCKNGILLQWNSNEGQSCEVEITNETSTLRFNTSAS